MDDETQLVILKLGATQWNRWRKTHHDKKVNFYNANLEQASLQGVNLQGVSLEQANLRGANLRGAFLQGVDLQNAVLLGTNLERTILRGANLTKAILEQAHLERTNLEQANLTETDLRGANLTGANLTGANLTETDLRRANLTGANLQQANLTKTDLIRTIFQNIVLSATTFTNVDLAGVIGLETVHHHGPSEISISTLYKSRGNIPEIFLRGCGVSDSLIDYLPSLIGSLQPIQFYSCFISYSTKDEDFAKRLHSRMQQEHLRVWFAPEELKGGHKLRDQIDDAIRVYDKLLLILSEASMQSDWVAHEIRRAYTREQRDGKRVLFPIRLCDFESLADWELHDGPRDLAREVREYHIPDFSAWKEYDAFEAAFAQLLKALRADEKSR